jgi:hypothetical protein
MTDLITTGRQALESVRAQANATVAVVRDSAALVDLTVAAISNPGECLPVFNTLKAEGSDTLPGQEAVANPKTAWDRLFNRIQNAAKRRGFRIILRFSKKEGRYTAAMVQRIETIGTDTDAGDKPSVADAPLNVTDIRDRILALCAGNGASLSEVLIATINHAGAGVQSAIAAHLSAPLAPLAAADSLPITGLTQEAISASVQGIAPRRSRRSK